MSSNNETFLFSLIKKYFKKYSKQPNPKTMFIIKRKIVPKAMDLYKREMYSYDDALEKALEEIQADT